MNARACVTTAKGTAAIASILIEGPDAPAILANIFKSNTAKKPDLKPGDVRVGDITNNNQIVDHVVIACKAGDSFEICCHGNPLIVEAIMRLLGTGGAQLVTVEEIVREKFAAESKNTIAAEAKLQQLKAITVEGVRIIAHQAQAGLAQTARKWLSDLDSLTLKNSNKTRLVIPSEADVIPSEAEESAKTTPRSGSSYSSPVLSECMRQIAGECKEILARTQTAKLIIDGCKAVIAGPPNSGKSTLLNCLAGRQKAIVTDIAGTTRDWVSAACRMGPLVVEFVDTAGLDETLTAKDSIDYQARKKTSELLSECDIILFVIDATKPQPIQPIQTDKPLIAILNKSDLPTAISDKNTTFDAANMVRISAKTGDGIDELTDRIQTVLGVSGLKSSVSTCFTNRQRRLVAQIAQAKSLSGAKSLIVELLIGPISVT